MITKLVLPGFGSDGLADQKTLHRLFENVNDKLVWKVRPHNQIQIGDEAGFVHPHGYTMIRMCRRTYAAHRLIWVMAHGE